MVLLGNEAREAKEPKSSNKQLGTQANFHPEICAVLGAEGICATGLRRAQGNQHCSKFESHTNRVTFETNAISITSSIHAPYSCNMPYIDKKGNYVLCSK